MEPQRSRIRFLGRGSIVVSFAAALTAITVAAGAEAVGPYPPCTASPPPPGSQCPTPTVEMVPVGLPLFPSHEDHYSRTGTEQAPSYSPTGYWYGY
jgi:hypothetical protein